MLLAVLASAALAASGGFYHPDDVAAASRTFSSASQRLSDPVSDLQGKVDGLAAALQGYREGLDLLGARAPAAERDRLAALEVSYNRQHAAAQAFVDHLVGGFDDAFVAAKERAVAGLGVPAVECRAEVPDGAQLPGMRPRTRPNPDCHGENLNSRVAAAMDADSQLTAALDQLLGAPFPTFSLPSEPQATVGAGDRWVSVDSFVRAAARDRLTRINAEDDTARADIDALVEQGATAAELTARQGDASKIAAETAAKRAALGEPLLSAADRVLAREARKGGAVGWCAQPGTLGGCVGTDASAREIPVLLEDSRVVKAAGG